MHNFEGPHFSADLIGPDGKLSRLHKGGKPPKAVPPPPPVRESNRQVAAVGETARAAAAKRKGLQSTLGMDKPQSLLGGVSSYDQPGSRSLL
ncbi:hypothetical protein HQ447_16335 [bacterium]|nr:hypothetical protein [bacterium]